MVSCGARLIPPDNATAFAKPNTQQGETPYPQVRMLCQVELTSHLLTQVVMENCTVSEVVLAERLPRTTPSPCLTRGSTRSGYSMPGRALAASGIGCCR